MWSKLFGCRDELPRAKVDASRTSVNRVRRRAGAFAFRAPALPTL